MKTPNWKESKDYDYVANLDGHAWAWEFLRRDKEFLNDLEKMENGTLTDLSGNLPQSFQDTNFGIFTGTAKFFLFPPLKAKESIRDWLKKYVQDNDRKYLKLESFLRWKWRIKKIADPNQPCLSGQNYVEFYPHLITPKIINYLHQVEQLEWEEGEISHTVSHYDDTKTINDGTVLLALSLKNKIGPQLQSIRKNLEDERKGFIKKFPEHKSNEKGPHAKLLKRRLRLLDALNQNDKPSDTKIQDHIYISNRSGSEFELLQSDKKWLTSRQKKRNYNIIASTKL